MRRLSASKEREVPTLAEITKMPLTFRKIPKSAQIGSKSTLNPVTFPKTQNSKTSLRIYSNLHFKSQNSLFEITPNTQLRPIEKTSYRTPKILKKIFTRTRSYLI